MAVLVALLVVRPLDAKAPRLPSESDQQTAPTPEQPPGAVVDEPEKKSGFARFQEWVSKRLNVQQVIKDKNSVDKPAFLSLVFPNEGSKQVDTSVSAALDAIATPTLQAGVAVEFVEKTGIDKPQNNLTLGFEGTWVGHVGHVETGGIVRVAAFNPRLEGEVKYKKDGVLTTKGVAGALRFTTLVDPTVFRWGPYDRHTLVGSFRFRWEPRIGLEVEEVISAKTDTEPTGTWLRSYSEISVYLYPFGKHINDQLVLSWTYSYRKDLSVPGSFEKASHNLRTYSALAYFDSGRKFSIGVDRVSGQDPSQGFKEQAFTRVSFKLRLRPS